MAQKRIEKPDPDRALELLCRRDESAVAMLEALYGKQIKSLARRILGSAEDAEEVANDTLHELWLSAPPESPENLKAFVLSVCRKTAVDRLRFREAKKRASKAQQPLDELDEAAESFEDQAVDSMVINEVVERFLAELSERDRRIFMKRYYLFQPVRHIASSLGLSTPLVKSSLLRMRNKLAQELERELK